MGEDDEHADEDSLNIWCVQWPIPALSLCFNLLGDFDILFMICKDKDVPVRSASA